MGLRPIGKGVWLSRLPLDVFTLIERPGDGVDGAWVEVVILGWKRIVQRLQTTARLLATLARPSACRILGIAQQGYAWLRHALERLPLATSVDDCEALLRWNYTPRLHS